MMYIFFRIGRKLRDYHISLVLLTTRFNHPGKLILGYACSSLKCVLPVQNIGFSLQHSIKQDMVVHLYPSTQGVESGSQKLKAILGCYIVSLRPVCDHKTLSKKEKRRMYLLCLLLRGLPLYTSYVLGLKVHHHHHTQFSNGFCCCSYSSFVWFFETGSLQVLAVLKLTMQNRLVLNSQKSASRLR